MDVGVKVNFSLKFWIFLSFLVSRRYAIYMIYRFYVFGQELYFFFNPRPISKSPDVKPWHK